ncbi:MAG: hypothetical protein Unbinned3891contig1000_25 [Prokaryotic dsDNA virus sp.]|nr:MAG: hypothetical protein Unbinned3891contig1000_25 [Prokaryotic dsDNA virus sp.]|tara:strand:- start:9725 stop:10774 length:1050 start_codon:yes stop_codon:yes gene_type:complete
MKYNREELLKLLALAKPGLSSRDFVEQSSCFAFDGKYVFTFNDEVACRVPLKTAFRGAVKSASLLSILEKVEDNEVVVQLSKTGKQLIVRTKGRRLQLAFESEIRMPLEAVETPKEWKSLPRYFDDAIRMCASCVTSDESKFKFTCVHLHPKHIEACDNYKFVRCRFKTGLRVPILVRGSALAGVHEMGFNEMCVTKLWLHLRNSEGLVFSCRRFLEEYPSLDKFSGLSGEPFSLPKGLEVDVDLCEGLVKEREASPFLEIELEPRKLTLRGVGMSGIFTRVARTTYTGKPALFSARPSLVRDLLSGNSDAQLCDNSVVFSGSGSAGKWEFVTMLAKKLGRDEMPDTPE